jgi:cardiolipin synthase
LTLALKSASEKKVKIKLILSGNSDIPLLKNATYFFYAYYLKNNIEIYEWDKSVLHGKAAVVDGSWSTIGSFNLNHLSSYASIEMNLGIHSKTFSEDFQLHLSQIIKECRKIAPDTIDKKQTIITQIKNRICYWLIKITLITITYFPYKRFMKLK